MSKRGVQEIGVSDLCGLNDDNDASRPDNAPKPSVRKSERKKKSVDRNILDAPPMKKPKEMLKGPLKDCNKILVEMLSRKNYENGCPFYEPVDTELLGLDDYHEIIKKPMDLGTIKSKMLNREYKSAEEFAADIRLMFANCYQYNPAKDEVVKRANKLEELFESKFSKIPCPSKDLSNDLPVEKENDSVQPKSILNSKSTASGHSGFVASEEEEEDNDVPMSTASRHSRFVASEEEEEDNVVPMSYDEIRELSLKVYKQPLRTLIRVVILLRELEPEQFLPSPTDVEINFRTLKSSTLRKLEKALASYEKTNSSPVDVFDEATTKDLNLNKNIKIPWNAIPDLFGGSQIEMELVYGRSSSPSSSSSSSSSSDEESN